MKWAVLILAAMVFIRERSVIDIDTGDRYIMREVITEEEFRQYEQKSLFWSELIKPGRIIEIVPAEEE